MSEIKKNNGGKREGSGRKKRATEAACYSIKIDKIDVDAIRKLKLNRKIRDAIKLVIAKAEADEKSIQCKVTQKRRNQ